MARDNFPKSVINILQSRVANRCSKPDCRVPTTAASSKNDKVNNIGIAAHINAASIGGPRYLPEMTRKERKSIDNAIWLCSGCSIQIDRDAIRFTVDILKKWKVEAEELARQELGKRPPNKNDTIDTLTTALTGFPKKFIVDAISNTHQASEKSLEVLDPRFLIKSSHNDGETIFGIHAKEDVNFTMNILGDYAKEFLEKHQRLIEHGEELEIHTSAVHFEGSNLLTEISSILNDGKLTIGTYERKGTQKIWLVNKETSVIETFDDIKGTLIYGSKSFRFQGECCDQLFALSYRKFMGEMEAKIDLGVNFEKWEHNEVMRLPYLKKLLSLFEKLAYGWELHMSLEVDGNTIVNSKGIDISDAGLVKDIHSALHYIDKAATLCSHFNLPVKFVPGFSYTAEDHKKLIEIVDILEGKCSYTQSQLRSNPSFELVVHDPKSFEAWIRDRNPTDIVILHDAEKIIIFGHSIDLPQKSVTIKSAIPIMKSKGEVCAGDLIKVELQPVDGFELKIEFQQG